MAIPAEPAIDAFSRHPQDPAWAVKKRFFEPRRSSDNGKYNNGFRSGTCSVLTSVQILEC